MTNAALAAIEQVRFDMSNHKALRYNKGKAPLSYVTSAKYALEGCAEVFAFGAEKYDRDNWKKGLPSNEIIDSLLRHLTQYQEGETHDEESGCHHLDHILCNAIFLAYHHNGKKEEAECKK